MYGVRRSFQAVVVLFAVTFFGSPAFSQSARFFSVEARPMGVPGPASSADPCSVNENRSIAARAGDRNGSASCSHSLAKASAPMPAVLCNGSTRAVTPCPASSDAVRDDLNTMGKQGQLILRARDKVLEILQTGNACTAWYRTKEPDPASAFRTLTFALDRDGESYVRKILESGGIEL